MNMIGGVDVPTSGSVRIEGQEITQMNESELAIFRRRNIGMIYQFYNLIPTLTAEENIMLPWLLDQRKEDRKKLQDILTMLKLEKRAKHLPGQMSGGQQQRVSIGRAMINDPAFILADEPTGNLDPSTSWEIMSCLQDINKRGVTIIMATHEREIVNTLKKRVIEISSGQISKDVNEGGYDDEIEYSQVFI